MPRAEHTVSAVVLLAKEHETTGRQLFRFLKVLIGEYIRCGPNESETDLPCAGVAGREQIAFDHHNLMRLAVPVFVNCLVDAAL